MSQTDRQPTIPRVELRIPRLTEAARSGRVQPGSTAAAPAAAGHPGSLLGPVPQGWTQSPRAFAAAQAAAPVTYPAAVPAHAAFPGQPQGQAPGQSQQLGFPVQAPAAGPVAAPVVEPRRVEPFHLPAPVEPTGWRAHSKAILLGAGACVVTALVTAAVAGGPAPMATGGGATDGTASTNGAATLSDAMADGSGTDGAAAGAGDIVDPAATADEGAKPAATKPKAKPAAKQTPTTINGGGAPAAGTEPAPRPQGTGTRTTSPAATKPATGGGTPPTGRTPARPSTPTAAKKAPAHPVTGANAGGAQDQVITIPDVGPVAVPAAQTGAAPAGAQGAPAGAGAAAPAAPAANPAGQPAAMGPVGALPTAAQ